MVASRTSADGGMETSYGFRDVAEGEKQGLVNDVFHKVAKRYDIMNDVMSAYMHRVWKDALIAALNPRKDANYKVLDVAGGTGDIAFRIVEASRRLAHATVLDINGSMLGVGQERAQKKASPTISPSSRPMPRPCPSRPINSTPIRSPSVFATCPASMWR